MYEPQASRHQRGQLIDELALERGPVPEFKPEMAEAPRPRSVPLANRLLEAAGRTCVARVIVALSPAVDRFEPFVPWFERGPAARAAKFNGVLAAIEHSSSHDDREPVRPQLARSVGLAFDGSLYVCPGWVASAVASEHAVRQLAFDEWRARPASRGRPRRPLRLHRPNSRLRRGFERCHSRGVGRALFASTIARIVGLDAIADGVSSRRDFVRFLRALLEDLRRELARPPEETKCGAGEWAHADLEGFLETWAAWLEDLTPESPQWRSYGIALDSLAPDAWRLFAEMLLVARVHE